MKTVYLSREDAADLDMLYGCLDRELQFPDYFGHNLDALYDVLTDICEETHISLPEAGLPDKVSRVLLDAERDNKAIHLHFRPSSWL